MNNHTRSSQINRDQSASSFQPSNNSNFPPPPVDQYSIGLQTQYLQQLQQLQQQMDQLQAQIHHPITSTHLSAINIAPTVPQSHSNNRSMNNTHEISIPFHGHDINVPHQLNLPININATYSDLTTMPTNITNTINARNILNSINSLDQSSSPIYRDPDIQKDSNTVLLSCTAEQKEQYSADNMCILHNQARPQSAKSELLVYGWMRRIRQCFIPSVIIKLCANFYDEVMYWKLDRNELETYYQSKILSLEIFEINNIKFQCSFFPNKTQQDSVFYVDVFLPNDVEKISVYSEVFCTENDAHFRYVESIDHQRGQTSYMEYGMYLKCEQFECINIAAYFEILSIQYRVNKKIIYPKPIFMKRKLSYIWHFDTQMINKFRKASTRQMFLSETFDEINRNWGLRIIPMDFNVNDTSMRKRRIKLILDLCKRPATEATEELNIIWKVTNDFDNVMQINAVTFKENDENSWRYLKPSFDLFESDHLFGIESFNISIEIEVISFGTV